jgi:hypothetical protein
VDVAGKIRIEAEGGHGYGLEEEVGSESIKRLIE